MAVDGDLSGKTGSSVGNVWVVVGVFRASGHTRRVGHDRVLTRAPPPEGFMVRRELRVADAAQ